MLEPSAKCERLLNGWAAQLSNWTCHRQDSEKNARWPSKDWCSAFLSIFSFSSFSLICCSMSIFELLLYSCSLYSFMSLCIFHAALLMNSPTYSFFIWACFLCFCLYIFAFLSHWSIADTVFYQWAVWGWCMYVYMCACVHLHDFECMRLFAHWINSEWTVLVLFS